MRTDTILLPVRPALAVQVLSDEMVLSPVRPAAFVVADPAPVAEPRFPFAQHLIGLAAFAFGFAGGQSLLSLLR